jgi:subtilase family serine protease
MSALCRLSYQYFCALAAVTVAMQFSSPLLAQETSAGPAAVPQVSIAQPLITQPVDEAQLTVLKGNTHALARPAFDLGTAPATLPMQRMLLVLKRSPQQEAALRKLLDEQQSKGSPNYHKWLTPAPFGQQFGPSDSDMQTIILWLQSHGFQVGSTKGRSVLEFSGSASQVKEAFHTTIHKYIVKGEQHWANASDPSIPTALTPAVAGVLTLHNFLSKPHIHFSPQPVAAKLVSAGPGKRPQVTFPAQGGQPTTYALAPQDYATIYNISPVYNGATGVNTGSGTSIAVVGRSNLYNGSADVENFYNMVGSGIGFGSPNFNIVLDGPDPGDLGGGEEAEATLDSTWSGAIAPGATVDLVVSASTNTTDGIDLSELYIVENNLADIMTESFGTCEY